MNSYFSSNTEETAGLLKQRITILNERAWEHKLDNDAINRWLENFTGRTGLDPEIERIHALYLLSQFMYFGSREIRVLLRAIYNDLFLAPLIQETRQALGNTRDLGQISQALNVEISKTRFLGVGNPSESGVHLLYYFRQENGLSKLQFADNAQIITRDQETQQRVLRYPEIERYVFVDDVCGSGETAVRYSNDFLKEMLNLSDKVKVYYFCLFANADGMKVVRDDSAFGNNCGAVYEFDKSYKCVDDDSRYFKSTPRGIDLASARKVADVYGQLLCPGHPRGYLDSQMLLGFTHNTPDNTLPIIWMDSENHAGTAWTPAFRRYPKV